MNFFEHQAAARRSSTRLVVLFALAVAGIVLAVDLVIWMVTHSPGAVAFASMATLAVIGLGHRWVLWTARIAGPNAGNIVTLQYRVKPLSRMAF